MDEVVDGIVAAVVLELVDELFAAYIQHHFAWIVLFNIVTYRLGKMGFPHTSTSRKQWICLPTISGYTITM